MEAPPRKTQWRDAKLLKMRTFSYSCVKYSPESHDFSSQLRKSNTKISILFFSFLLSFFFLSFFFSIKHNSKSVQCIQTIHTPNECSIIKDLPFLGLSCMQAKINELWPKTRVTMAFLYAILCVFQCDCRDPKNKMLQCGCMSGPFSVWHC